MRLWLLTHVTLRSGAPTEKLSQQLDLWSNTDTVSWTPTERTDCERSLVWRLTWSNFAGQSHPTSFGKPGSLKLLVIHHQFNAKRCHLYSKLSTRKLWLLFACKRKPTPLTFWTILWPCGRFSRWSLRSLNPSKWSSSEAYNLCVLWQPWIFTSFQAVPWGNDRQENRSYSLFSYHKNHLSKTNSLSNAMKN